MYIETNTVQRNVYLLLDLLDQISNTIQLNKNKINTNMFFKNIT